MTTRFSSVLVSAFASVCLLACDDAASGADGGGTVFPPGSGGSAADGGGITAVPGDGGVIFPGLRDGSVPPSASDGGAVVTPGPVTTVDGGAEPDATTPAGPGGSGGACLQGITDFDKAGPFEYAAKTVGRIKYWVPAVPAGCKVPVVHLANGTGASCSAYQQVLNRLASHGFLAACYEDTNTGAGSQGLEALQKAYEQFPDLVDDRIGSTGHSQGGQAAFTVLELAEKTFGTTKRYAGLAMQPASGFGSQPSGGSWQQVYGRIRSPMFMFSGTADTLVSESWVRRGLDALADDIEAYWWSANGATHIPTPQGPTNSVAVAWFRWKLLDDAAACAYFKALPDGSAWDVRKEQNAVSCP
jgi:dienelactone hydrolase